MRILTVWRYHPITHLKRGVLSLFVYQPVIRLRIPFLSLVFLLMAASAAAQTADEAEGLPTIPALAVVSTQPIVDGRVTESAWMNVDTLPLTVIRPVFEAAPSQRTEIRIAYDEEYLYASAIMYEEDPSLIRMNSLQRDIWRGDDAFHLHLDTFNDNESGYWFWVTPAGTKGESLVTNDAEGAGAVSNSWNTIWDAAVARTAQGWSVEMRIPLRNLSFRRQNGPTTIGVTTGRLIARTNELITWPAVDPRWDHHKPSRSQDVSLIIPELDPVVHVTPYTATRTFRTARAAQNGFDTGQEADFGLDAKVNLTRNLTLDLTANTDFAQVEADDQQINFTEFSLFFPEKRQFFQERAGIFNFGMARRSRLFHGRRIGLDGAGNPLPILGGAKLVGRLGAWDVGALNVQTKKADAAPSENFGVVRLRRSVINAFSTVGLLATSRFHADGSRNVAWGMDTSIRMTGADDYVTVKWSATDDSDIEASLLRRSNMYLQLQRRALTGLRYNFFGGRIGDAWTPGVGFVGQRDILAGTGVVSYAFQTDDHPWIRSIRPSIVFIRRHRLRGGGPERNFIGPWVELWTKRGDFGWIEPRFNWQDQANGFTIGDDVRIPVGLYRWADVQLYYSASTGRRMRSDINLEVGGFYDGRMRRLTVGPTWNASRFVEVGLDYQYADFDFSSRGEALTTHLIRLRLRTAANTRVSLSGLVQYNSVAQTIDGNLRFRYNVRDGQDLWLVYNEGLNTARDTGPGAPPEPISYARTLVFKYTHTLSI